MEVDYSNHYLDEINTLISEAEKCLNPGFFRGIFSSLYDDDIESKRKACKLYHKASEKYRFIKDFRKSGEILLLCAELSSEDYQKIVYYREAFGCYNKLDDGDRYVKLGFCVDKLLGLYIDKADFYNAGKLSETLGDIAENHQLYKEAIGHYSKASDFYGATITNNNSTISSCILKRTSLLIKLGDFKEANMLFIVVEEMWLSSNMYKYKLAELYLDICFCFLELQDIVALNKTINKFGQIHNKDSFSEYRLLKTLFRAVEENNVESLEEIALKMERGWKYDVLQKFIISISKEVDEDNFS